MLFKNCRFVFTGETILENVDVYVSRGFIRAVGDVKWVGNSIDCSNKILIPGLVNSHAHLPLVKFRGLIDYEELPGWLDKVLTWEKEMSPEEVEYYTLLGIKENLLSGVTCIVNSYFSSDVIYKVFKKVGIRGVLNESLINSSINIAKFLTQKDRLVKFGVAAGGVFTGDDFIRKVVRISDKYGSFRSIHVSENRRDVFYTQKKYGCYPIEYLERLGFLGERSILNHCSWVTRNELLIIKENNSFVSHNPISNMKLAGGSVFPLKEALSMGIKVGIGTDSQASNNANNLLEEIKFCSLLQRFERWDAGALRNEDVLKMVINFPYRFLGFEGVGCIEEGWRADVVTLNLDPNLLPISKERVISHLVFSVNPKNVSEVMVDGKLLVKGGRLLF